MLLSRSQTAEDAVGGGGIDWDVSVDSTAVRAHQHAAGEEAPQGALRRAADEALPGFTDADLREQSEAIRSGARYVLRFRVTGVFTSCDSSCSPSREAGGSAPRPCS